MFLKPIFFFLPPHLKFYQYQSNSHADNISAFIQLKRIIFTKLKRFSFPFTHLQQWLKSIVIGCLWIMESIQVALLLFFLLKLNSPNLQLPAAERTLQII